MNIHYIAIPAVFLAGGLVGYDYARSVVEDVIAEYHKIEAEGVADAKAVVASIKNVLHV